MSAEDPNLWTKIASGAAGLASLLAGVIWTDNKNRVQKCEESLAKKADDDDVKECRRHIEQLYKNAEGDRKLVRDLHDGMVQQLRESESRIMEAIHGKFPGRT